MIEPPDYVSDGARPAFKRITDKLLARGLWEPIYTSMAAVSAMQATLYVDACRIHGARAPVVQECRGIARLLLADMLWLETVVEVREDDLGRDIDLLELCLPLQQTED